jgi:ankyrin repeat protein
MNMANDGEMDWYEREKMHFAAQNGDLGEVRRLVEAGRSVNEFDEYLGRTPLHYAVASNYLEVVRYLIRSGANVNSCQDSKVGDTALGHSSTECSLEMAQLLVDSGADPTIVGASRLTALDRTAKRKDAEGPQVHQLLVNTAKLLHPDWNRLKDFT